MDGAVHVVERGRHDDHTVAASLREPNRKDPEGLAVEARGDGRASPASLQHAHERYRRDQGAPRHRVAARFKHGAGARQELRGRLALRQARERGVAHVLELALASVLEAEGDLRRADVEALVDPVHQVGPQPDHEEPAERGQDHGEERDVPDRQPRADRQAHPVSGSSA